MLQTADRSKALATVSVPLRLLLAVVLGLFACADDRAHCDGDACGASQAVGSSRARGRVPPAFCARGTDDAVRDLFCAEQAPEIHGIHDVAEQLGMLYHEEDLRPADQEAMITNFSADYGHPALVLLNTSTALPGRFVSTLNPRAIRISPSAIMAFNRGVQQLELAASDRREIQRNFYLLSFEQACNSAPSGCSFGDLYSPRVESDWTRVQIDDDEGLKNTAADCRQCHQRASEHGILLMRELDGPWTHFFALDHRGSDLTPEPNGVDIIQAYHEAKGDEAYGGIPWAAIRGTTANTLQNLVGTPQPLVFDSGRILEERWTYDVTTQSYSKTPLRSLTWEREYAAFKRGEHLALPYFEPFASDAGKLQRLSNAYRDFREGRISADELPDLGDVFPDDPEKRAQIGLQTEPNATPAETLVQACGSCHNRQLDQSLSRARFSIDIASLGGEELALAAARVSLPLEHPQHMPPRDFRQVDPGVLPRLIAYLEQGDTSQEDAASLAHAAELGMTVPTVIRSFADMPLERVAP